MATVGVRELRQRASELLRRVEAGETIKVTDRGRPVAVLAPLPQAGALERLPAAGEGISATGRLRHLPLPLAGPCGEETPSAIPAPRPPNERRTPPLFC